jgi:hypothetical protein
MFGIKVAEDWIDMKDVVSASVKPTEERKYLVEITFAADTKYIGTFDTFVEAYKVADAIELLRKM